MTRERARREAKRADAALRRRDAKPLTGIPYGAKDLLAAKGARTTWGAPPYRDQVFDREGIPATLYSLKDENRAQDPDESHS